jgi:ketosteroid isomerase-like protein
MTTDLPQDMTSQAKIALARNLFEAWSFRARPDDVDQFAHPDIVLWDAHVGELRGLSAIKPRVVAALAIWPDMDYEIGKVWVNDQGAAISWVMTATVTEALAEKYGADKVGQRWRSPGISALRMRAGRVVQEQDYYDPVGLRRSLGLHKSRQA